MVYSTPSILLVTILRMVLDAIDVLVTFLASWNRAGERFLIARRAIASATGMPKK